MKMLIGPGYHILIIMYAFTKGCLKVETCQGSDGLGCCFVWYTLKESTDHLLSRGLTSPVCHHCAQQVLAQDPGWSPEPAEVESPGMGKGWEGNQSSELSNLMRGHNGHTRLLDVFWYH